MHKKEVKMQISAMLNDDLRKQHIDKKLNIVWNDIVSITEALKAGDVQEKDLKGYIEILEEASSMTEEIGLLLFPK